MYKINVILLIDHEIFQTILILTRRIPILLLTITTILLLTITTMLLLTITTITATTITIKRNEELSLGV